MSVSVDDLFLKVSQFGLFPVLLQVDFGFRWRGWSLRAGVLNFYLARIHVGDGGVRSGENVRTVRIMFIYDVARPHDFETARWEALVYLRDSGQIVNSVSTDFLNEIPLLALAGSYAFSAARCLTEASSDRSCMESILNYDDAWPSVPTHSPWGKSGSQFHHSGF